MTFCQSHLVAEFADFLQPGVNCLTAGFGPEQEHLAVGIVHPQGKSLRKQRKRPVKAYCVITGVMAGCVQSA